MDKVRKLKPCFKGGVPRLGCSQTEGLPEVQIGTPLHRVVHPEKVQAVVVAGVQELESEVKSVGKRVDALEKRKTEGKAYIDSKVKDIQTKLQSKEATVTSLAKQVADFNGQLLVVKEKLKDVESRKDEPKVPDVPKTPAPKKPEPAKPEPVPSKPAPVEPKKPAEPAQPPKKQPSDDKPDVKPKPAPKEPKKEEPKKDEPKKEPKKEEPKKEEPKKEEPKKEEPKKDKKDERKPEPPSSGNPDEKPKEEKPKVEPKRPAEEEKDEKPSKKIKTSK